MLSTRKLCKAILGKEMPLQTFTLKKIGTGMGSVVYRATAHKKDVVVKIKLTQGDLSSEYFALKYIEKQHIAPKAIAHGSFNGTHYLLEEYVTGTRLPKKGITDTQVSLVAKFYQELHRKKFRKRGYLHALAKQEPFDPSYRLHF